MNNAILLKPYRVLAVFYLLLIVLTDHSVFCREIDMKTHWNDQIALENPHKGWYHHYPDNHINKYIIREDSHLLDFPGMDHVYIRLSWAYLEPKEGKFDWDIIDNIINKWTENGLKISFRISCKETSTDRIEQQFATPKWVMEAGAKGDYYRQGEIVGSDGPWEPVFDDPVFLAKLENFLRVFAARYDGKPWLRYVDIGSIGDWGEGHTWAGSKIDYTMDQKRLHIDLYCKYFRKTQLIITDDFVYNIKNPKNRGPLHQYVMQQGISYRDDSPLVNGYVQGYTDTYTVRSPEFFEDTYRQAPTVFELEHYHKVKSDGNWKVKEGSALSKYALGKTGPDFFRGAMDLLHATYLGYHGDAHDWLMDNPKLTVELLNRCGYWFFLHQVDIPDPLRIGGKNTLQMVWENRGVAPAYHPYILKVRLVGAKTVDFELESENRKWMPVSTDGVHREKHIVTIPDGTPPGPYDLKLKLYSNDDHKDVLLALDPTLLDEENYYRIATVQVTKTCIQDFAPKPPLGFNSFDSYRSHLTEDKAYALMDMMAEKYLPFGYQYFVMDAGWYTRMEPEKHAGLDLDSFGLYVVRQAYFPNGIKVLADYAHNKGLKFGVWLMRGIPREAVKQNLPIKGTPYFARDIADTNSVCVWNASNYGVDMTKPGAQAYYNTLINTLARWGIDFIKVDDMVPNPPEIVAIAKAIEAGGHTMIYSLSPGDVHHPTHLPYYRRANMLRITRDIWDNPLSLEKGFFAWEKFQGTERPGFWPDLDMIPFGRLDVVNQQARQSEFNQNQMKTFITQRALAASPLIIGGDLLTMDEYSYSLLTNREMLACNQNGVMGVNVYRAGNIDVWITPHKLDPGTGWIGIFNRTKSDRTVTLTKQDLGFITFEASYNLTASRYSFRLNNIWSDEIITIEDKQSFALPAEGVAFFKFQMQ